MRKIIICDADLNFQQDVIKMIHDAYPNQYQITTFADGTELVYEIQDAPFDYDLILLDIFMARMNGIEAGLKIRTLNQYIPIIYITKTDNYALRGYEVQAFRYILKPLDPVQFLKIFELAIAQVERSKREDFIAIRNRQEIEYKSLSEIIFCEGNERKVSVHTLGNQYEYYKKLIDLEILLEPRGFSRIHRSYLVNLQHLKQIDFENSIVLLTNNISLRISKARIVPLLSAMEKIYKNKMIK